MSDKFDARWYYQEIAAPTIREFLLATDNRRRAMASAVALIHVVDYVMHDRHEPPEAANSEVRALFVREFTRDPDGALTALKDFADVSKHAKLSRSNAKGFEVELNQLALTPAILGVAKWGASLWNDRTGGIAIKRLDGTVIKLEDALKQTMERFEALFPEIGKAELV